jgi:ribose transport system permease protein
MAVAVAVWYLLTQTVFGRNLSAIGSNEQSATLVGIKVPRVVFVSFLISGLLGSLAGMLLIANQGNANPAVGGINVMLPALAGVFLGVSAFTPGKYNVPGTVVGLLFVAVAVSGLALLGVAPWVEPVFNGTAVVLAVTLSTFLGRSAGNA